MTLSEFEVSNQALGAAWEMVHLLDPNREPYADENPEAMMQEIASMCSEDDLFQGHLMIAGLLALQLGGPAVVERASHAAGEAGDSEPVFDPMRDLIPAVLRRMRDAFPEVPPHVHPTLTAVLVAGVLDQDVLQWASTHLPSPTPEERLGLVYLDWCLSDLHDSIHERPGVTNELFWAILTGEEPPN